MTRDSKPVTILVAEDDADDRLLLKDAFNESSLAHELRFVENGEQLLAYLRREGEFADPGDAPLAGLILLDLNMPKMDGREALNIIKNDSDRQDNTAERAKYLFPQENSPCANSPSSGLEE